MERNVRQLGEVDEQKIQKGLLQLDQKSVCLENLTSPIFGHQPYYNHFAK